MPSLIFFVIFHKKCLYYKDFQYFCKRIFFIAINNLFWVIMEKVSTMKVKDLIQDDKNFNKGTVRGQKLIEMSLAKFGAGRSVLLDKNNKLIAGNKTQENALKLGLEDVIVVETDGTKMVAVKRTDVDLDTKEGREMALADNRTSQENIDLDYVKMREALDNEQLEAWNVKEPLKTQTEMLSKLKYNSCYYEPKEKPKLKLRDCVNLDKYEKKMAAIKKMKLSDEEKEVLRLFAYRFIKIDFQSVADYYAFNASEEMQEAIERLRLVLVDNGEKGYIEDDMLKIVNAEINEELGGQE